MVLCALMESQRRVLSRAYSLTWGIVFLKSISQTFRWTIIFQECLDLLELGQKNLSATRVWHASLRWTVLSLFNALESNVRWTIWRVKTFDCDLADWSLSHAQSKVWIQLLMTHAGQTPIYRLDASLYLIFGTAGQLLIRRHLNFWIDSNFGRGAFSKFRRSTARQWFVRLELIQLRLQWTWHNSWALFGFFCLLHREVAWLLVRQG